VKRARDTSPIMTVRPDGSIEWRNKEGKYHCEDGPAREWPAQGAKAWYRNGKQLTAAEFAATRGKEIAEIGDAFKAGLPREITVSRPRPLKKSS